MENNLFDFNMFLFHLGGFAPLREVIFFILVREQK